MLPYNMFSQIQYQINRLFETNLWLFPCWHSKNAKFTLDRALAALQSMSAPATE